MKFMYSNLDRLGSKVNELNLMLDQHDIDIGFFTEIGIDENILTNFSINNSKYYEIFRGRDGKRKGGMGAVVRHGLNVQFVNYIKSKDQTWEIMILELTTGNDKELFVLNYKPPGLSDESQTEFIEILYDNCKNFTSSYMILGDFNFPDINWNMLGSSGRAARLFIERMSDLGLMQMVDQPTRMRGDSANILDLIYITDKTLMGEISYLHPIGKSDHLVLCWSVYYETDQSHIDGNSDRVRFDLTLAREILGTVNWRQEFDGLGLDESWSLFEANIKNLIGFISVVTKGNAGGRKNEWINRNVKNHFNRKTKAWKRLRKEGTLAAREAYKLTVDQLRHAINVSKTDYEKNMHEKARDGKFLFNYIKTKNECKKDIGILVEADGNVITKNQDMANALSAQFATFCSLRKMNDCATRECLVNHMTSNTDYKMFEDLIRRAILKLKMSNLAGPDGIPASVVRYCNIEFVEPLTIIFVKICEEARFPSSLKQANIIPIPKAKHNHNVSSYRPISIINTFAKVFETAIFYWLADETAIVDKDSRQHGFTRGRSTETNLLVKLNYILKKRELKKQTDVLYLDASKAFDIIPHDILLERILSLGANPMLVRILENYLKNRKQRVICNGHHSEWTNVHNGVPQGSALGPLLFKIFINHLDRCLPDDLGVLLYADDIKIFSGVGDLCDVRRLQLALDNVNQWFAENFMQLNHSKCIFISYGVGKYTLTNYTYNIKDYEIEKINLTRDLGVYFDEELNFDYQTNSVINKANALYFYFKHNISYWSPFMTNLIYVYYIKPILEYCSVIWHPIGHGNKCKANKLLGVQRRVTKLCPNIKNCDFQDRFKFLGLININDNRLSQDLILLFKLTFGYVDMNFNDFAILNTSNTRNHGYKIFIERFKCSQSMNAFPRRIIDQWNKLPETAVGQNHNLNVFKKYCKNLFV